MSNFRDFYLESKEASPSLGNSLSAYSPAGLASSIQSSVAAISMAGFDSGFDEREKFSGEVAQCATSEEVISAVSDGVGNPKPSETEDEFVERASNVLRKILREKFNSSLKVG